MWPRLHRLVVNLGICSRASLEVATCTACVQEIDALCGAGRIAVFDIGGGMPVDYSTDADGDAEVLHCHL